MSGASAAALAEAGFPYIGTSYVEMDCQKFVEQCLKDCGIVLDLKGSNAWYRKMDWTGSPEECKKRFGSVPKGAFLFIHAKDGGEKKRGYNDGKGNASHIGLKTGRGQGAIHSSQSLGMVCESSFRDKSISGGWNKVGLWTRIDYGATINAKLRSEAKKDGAEDIPAESEGRKDVTGYVKAPKSGATVNMRNQPSMIKGEIIRKCPDGEEITILEEGIEKNGATWCRISAGGRTGYMMSKFIRGEQAESGEGTVTVSVSAADAQKILPVMENIVEQIVGQIGRG